MPSNIPVHSPIKKRYFFLLLPLVLLGFAISLHLTRIHYPLVSGESKGFAYCHSGCDMVNGSRFSEFAGIPLSSYGAVFYGLLLFLVLFGFFLRKVYSELSFSLIALLSFLALVVDGALLYVSLVHLKSFCGLCGLTYLVNLNCLLIALWGLLRSPGEILALPAQQIKWALSLKGSHGEPSGVYYQRIASFLFVLLFVLVGGSGVAISYLYDSRYEGVSTLEKLQQLIQQYEQMNRVQIDPARAPSRGPAQAPLTIIDFSDFKCPHCKYASNILTRLLEEYRGEVRLVFKQFPNDSACNSNTPSHVPSSGSCLLAKAALCAHAQNRFWEYHDILFGNQGKAFTLEELVLTATQLGLKKEDFSACLEDPRTEELLRSEINQGIALGVRGTPVLFLNGKMLRGNPPPHITRFLIERELGRR